MSILDTFYVLFSTNARKAAEEIDDVKGASDDAAKGLKDVDAAANDVGASFVKMARDLAGPLLALASLGGIWTAASGRAAHVREIDMFATKVNSAVEDVDAFQRAITSLGGDGGAALDSLAVLAEKVNEAFSDGESEVRKDFGEWGVVFEDTAGEALGATDAMLNLASSLETVSRAEALARIKKLGIEDPATIDLLLRGRRALEDHVEEQKALGVVTEESARNTREFYETVSRAQNMVASWGNSILDKLIPALTIGAQAIVDLARWAGENETLVTGFFIGVAGAITAFYLPAMVKAAIATVIATWPFIAIGAAIAAVGAAFALAYEDVMAFLNGQPSLIGELYEKYEWFRQLVDLVGVAVRGIGEAAKWVWEQGALLFSRLGADASAAAPHFREAGAALMEGIGEAIDWIKEKWDAVGAPLFDKILEGIDFLGESFVLGAVTIRDALGGAFVWIGEKCAEMVTAVQSGIGGMVELIRGSATAIKEAMGSAFEWIREQWDTYVGPVLSGIGAARDYFWGDEAPEAPAGGSLPAAQAALSDASSSPMNGVTSPIIQGAAAGTGGSTRNVTIGDINVTTAATDPGATGRAVREALEGYMRDTSSQLDDGVRN